jgi:hypothetical protein
MNWKKECHFCRGEENDICSELCGTAEMGRKTSERYVTE